MPGMTETVPVLTGIERLLAAAVAALLLTGATGVAVLAPGPRTVEVAAIGALATLPPISEPSSATSGTFAPTPAPGPAPAKAPGLTARHRQPAIPGPAPAEPPQAGCPLPAKPRGKPYVPKPLPVPAVPDAALPAALPPGPKATSLSALRGKGIWVTNFKQTPVDVRGTVAKAKAAGLTSIWIRTGGRQGYYGDQFLPALVPAAHAAGIQIVGWDFPFLSDPVADARRAQQAYNDGVDAFAPDIETAAEGTHSSARRVSLYLSLVRSYAAGKPIAATVPRPTRTRLRSFPYAAFGAYADVFVPMIYWSCNEPGALVEQSLTQLGRWLPVAPAGQAYDMGDEGGRRGLPTRAETHRFLDVARRGGAIGASLWTVERIGPGGLVALTDYPWNRIPVRSG